jgi:hypothetical protein
MLNTLKKTSLCCIQSMLYVVYVLKPAKRADFGTIGRFVHLLMAYQEKGAFQKIHQCAWTPFHIYLFSGIVHHEVTRTHGVVSIDDEFVEVQRTYGTGLANDLQNSHKRSRRRIIISTALNRNPQGVVLMKVDLL